MKQFRGTIADKKLVDFNNFNNELDLLKDRLEFVQDNLNGDDGLLHKFFSTYIGEYYDVSPSQSGYLAEDTAVFNLLENLGTYIIQSKDVDTHRKVEYKFWVNEREFNNYKESGNVNESTLSNGSDDSVVEVIHMFVDKKKKNSKIVKPISINRQDLKDMEEVRNLENAIEYLKSPKGLKDIREHAESLLECDTLDSEDRSRLKYIAKNTQRYVAKYAKSLRENQVLIKKTIKKPIEFKSVLKDEGVPDKLDAFDFMEKRHVKSILPHLSGQDMMTEFGMIVYDTNKLINETKLSKKEVNIVEMFRNGFSIGDVTKELGCSNQNTNVMMNRIALKVVKSYENKLEKYRESVRSKKI